MVKSSLPKPKSRKRSSRVGLKAQDNLPACVASLVDIISKQEKRISWLEKRDQRRLIGFSDCESGKEVPEPTEEDIWEAGVVGQCPLNEAGAPADAPVVSGHGLR